MLPAKKEVTNLLRRLPGDCSLEDVQYHLYVLQKIERGLRDEKEGKIYTANQVMKRLSKWTGK